MNNLHPQVTEYPEGLVVYGGVGRAAQLLREPLGARSRAAGESASVHRAFRGGGETAGCLIPPA